MLVLDTNVLSELTRPTPDPRVAQWLALQPLDTLFLTSITRAEYAYGLARLPEGRRRDALEERTEALFTSIIGTRTLPFDEACATRYGVIKAAADRAGRPMSMADAQIAAICDRHGAVLATRNTSDFIDSGIRLVNPWASSENN